MKGRFSPAIGECGGAMYPYTQILRLAGAFVNAPSRFGEVEDASQRLRLSIGRKNGQEEIAAQSGKVGLDDRGRQAAVAVEAHQGAAVLSPLTGLDGEIHSHWFQGLSPLATFFRR